MSGVLTVGKIILTDTTSNNDAFDRIRISEPETLFEINATTGKLPFLIDEIISGAGTTSKEYLDNSYIKMGISASATGLGVNNVVRQSYEYVPYQPGKSRLMIFSGVLEAISGGVTGTYERIGSFDSYVEKTSVAGSGNGCFFELDGRTLYAVIRLNDTVTHNGNTRVAQLDWNFDKFNGIGPSGLTVNNYSTAKILAIDQEWLGVGQVRFGFFINGQFHVGHIFNHFDEGITMPYTKTAKLPIRYEIQGPDNKTAEMRMICSTILSEGGFEPTGITFTYGRSTPVVISTNYKPMISIKLRETEPYNRKSIILKSIELLNTLDRGLQCNLLLLPNKTYLTGGNTFTPIDLNNSVAEYNTTATGITGVTTDITSASDSIIVLDSGYADYSSTIQFNYDKYLASPIINSSIHGDSRVLCLCGVILVNNVTTYASLSWVEVL
jgi:hypothetical protein